MDVNTMRELKASRVRVPSDMIAITDSGPYNQPGRIVDCFGITPIHWNIAFPFSTPARVHGGGANVLFCDGHVQWYSADELIINETQAVMGSRTGQGRRPDVEQRPRALTCWRLFVLQPTLRRRQ
jgi:prepilin-type processing-associated H-X9-DG protein